MFSSIHETSFGCGAQLSSSLISLSFNSCIPRSLLLPVCCGKRQRKSDVSDLGLVLWAPEDGHVSQRSVPPHQSRLAGGRQASDGNEVSQCREGCRGAGAGSLAQKRCEERGWDREATACGVELVHVRGGFCRTRIMEG